MQRQRVSDGSTSSDDDDVLLNRTDQLNSESLCGSSFRPGSHSYSRRRRGEPESESESDDDDRTTSDYYRRHSFEEGSVTCSEQGSVVSDNSESVLSWTTKPSEDRKFEVGPKQSEYYKSELGDSDECVSPDKSGKITYKIKERRHGQGHHRPFISSSRRSPVSTAADASIYSSKILPAPEGFATPTRQLHSSKNGDESVARAIAITKKLEESVAGAIATTKKLDESVASAITTTKKGDESMAGAVATTKKEDESVTGAIATTKKGDEMVEGAIATTKNGAESIESPIRVTKVAQPSLTAGVLSTPNTYFRSRYLSTLKTAEVKLTKEKTADNPFHLLLKKNNYPEKLVPKARYHQFQRKDNSGLGTDSGSGVHDVMKDYSVSTSEYEVPSPTTKNNVPTNSFDFGV